MFQKICVLLLVGLAAVSCKSAISPLELSSDSGFSSRITNGQRANVGQFPWHALLAVQYRNDNTNRITFCGGAILNDLWILATGDCVANARTIRVEAGTVLLTRPAVTVFPELYIVHPQYNPNRFRNNLALLRLPLNRPFFFPSGPNPHFFPVRLPTLRQRNATFEGQESYFSGFGYTSLSSNNISNFLSFVEQRIISNRDCLGHYDNDQQLVSPAVLCSASFDFRQGPCNGDGGAPLVINEHGQWTLVGTLSFLHTRGSCGRQYAPSAFTRITSHFDWISRTANYVFRP